MPFDFLLWFIQFLIAAYVILFDFLFRTKSNTYTSGGSSHAQVVRVNHYTDVTVQSGGVLSAPAWDGNTGGILVFRASGRLTVEAGGLIEATGRGFRGGEGAYSRGQAYQGEGIAGIGGASYLANSNGGGGGWGDDFSGGGGGHGSAGGNGVGGVNPG